jgi:hypothetical protein
MRLAGRFSWRNRSYAKAHDPPVVDYMTGRWLASQDNGHRIRERYPLSV